MPNDLLDQLIEHAARPVDPSPVFAADLLDRLETELDRRPWWARLLPAGPPRPLAFAAAAIVLAIIVAAALATLVPRNDPAPIIGPGPAGLPTSVDEALDRARARASTVENLIATLQVQPSKEMVDELLGRTSGDVVISEDRYVLNIRYRDADHWQVTVVEDTAGLVGGSGSVWVRDGSQYLETDLTHERYVEGPAGPEIIGPGQPRGSTSGIRDPFDAAGWSELAWFNELLCREQGAVVGWDVVAGRNAWHITCRAPSEDWQEHVWIDPETGLRLRTTLGPKDRDPDRIVEFTRVELTEVTTAFDTTPPTGLRKRGTLPTGTTVPNIEGETIEGTSFSLSDLHGQHVLIAFVATWCEPCEPSNLSDIPDSVALVLVVSLSPLEEVAPFLQGSGLRDDAIVVQDPGTETDREGVIFPAFRDRFGLEGLPSYAFIDENGNLVDGHVGGNGLNAWLAGLGLVDAAPRTSN